MPQLRSIFVRVFRGELQNFDFSLLFSVEEKKKGRLKFSQVIKKKKKKRNENLEADPAEAMAPAGCRSNEVQ